MGLTPDEIDLYHRQGWLAPIDVLSAEEAGTALEILEEAERGFPELLNPNKRNNAHLCFPFLADLALNDRIVDVVRCIVGNDMSLHNTVLFIKEPDSSAYVSWHQDATYMGLTPHTYVTAWLALTESTENNGCVAMVSGSHHSGVKRHVDTYAEDNILARGQSVNNVEEDNAVNIELRPGQMSLHHPQLVHGSRPNRSGGRRVGFAMQSYLGSDVRPEFGVHHVMPIAGRSPTSSFVVVLPPKQLCSAEAVAIRDQADKALSDVLYRGASHRRDY